MLKDEVLRAVMDSPALPTLPTVASKLITLTSKSETSIGEIANLLSKDISLSAKVLRIANSAFYSFSSKISTVHQAVSNMGKNAIRSLVLSVSFLTIKSDDVAEYFSYEKFWQKSLSAAVAAKLIMAEIDKSDPEEIFIAALLQDIGELIVMRTFPEQYELVLKTLSETQNDVLTVEEQIIGLNHTVIGYEVTRNWGLPPELLIPIQYHHNPDGYTGNDKKMKLATKVVYLSGLIANVLSANRPQENHKKFIDKSKLMLGFNDRIIDRILEKVHSEIV
ncbi:MAG: HDOD domain-containing protein, partial [Planctomycetota bacterium]